MPSFRVFPVAASEGDGSLDVVFTLDGPAAAEVRLTYQLDNGTALYNGNADYQYKAETLVFAPGETSKTVSIVLTDNTAAEPTELFWLDVHTAVNATVTQRYTPLFIFDDDGTAGTPAITASAPVVDESGGSARFVVSLSRPSSTPVSVNYATADETATAGADYAAAAGLLTFAPGDMVRTVVVDLADDTLAETAEFFRLQFSNPVGATLTSPFASAEITANDAPVTGSPLIRARGFAAGEGQTTARFLVELSAPAQGNVSVNFATDNGTALYNGNSDFHYHAGTLVFLPGETSRIVTVPITADAVAEGPEVLWLDLSGAVGATVAQRYTAGLIVDDDGVTGTPAISIGDAVLDEAAGVAAFPVWLSRPSTGTVTVQAATADDTALAGSDYRATSRTLSFAPGEVVQTVLVDIVDDTAAEGRETFGLVLSAPTGATLAEAIGRGEIGANDGPVAGTPTVSARAVAAGESDTAIAFVVELDAPAQNVVTVSYQLDNGTALYNGNSDYHYRSETLTFAPGETTKTIPVLITDDAVAEPTEVFWLDLSGAAGATIPQRYTPAVIVDDDAVSGTPAVHVSDVVVDEGAGTASFFVALSRPSTAPVSVGYATADDTATAGADYRAAGGTLHFAPGETAKTVVVDITDDAVPEGEEFFRLMLSNPSGATLAEASGLAEIGHGDGAVTGTPFVGARAAAVGEGDVAATFVIQLSAPAQNPVSVTYQLDNGSALYNGNSDFQYRSETLTFAPGETTKTVPVLITDDTLAERPEVFWLDLRAGSNATVSQRYTPALIVDDDATTGTPAIRVADAVVDEGDRTAAFVVSLSRPATTEVTVAWATGDDTAAAGADYRAAAGTLRFAPGEMVKTVQVDVVDDGLAEFDERFAFTLSSPTGATLDDAHGAGVIARSDGPLVARPQISVLPVVAGEGDGWAAFVVALSAASPNTVSLDYALANGTAVYNGNADFQYRAETLVFAPGETVKTIPVLISNDTLAEGDEVFSLDIPRATNATVAQRLTTATIIDDDGAGTVHRGGIGPDSHLLTSVLDRIAEGPGGGIDTAVSPFSTTLPANVENLMLTGSAVNAIGNDGHNVLRGTAANNVFDGKGGVDTVVFSGPSGAYTATGTVASRTVTSAIDGSDTLASIERLQFTDVVRAEDTGPGGHTWLAWAMFNAGFDRAPSTAELSLWTAQLDRIGSAQGLAQAMINHYAPGVPDEALVAHLWGTIVETPIPLDALTAYVGLVASGTYTQAGLLELVATLDLNTAEIAGIVGQPVALDPAYFPVPG